MDNAASYLLSKDKLTRYYSALRNAKQEWQIIDDKFMLISKYHERLWFQRIWRASYDELLIEMKSLALSLDRIQLSIDEYELAIHQHLNAIEYLHKTNKPFEGLDLKQHQLTQKEIFQ